MKRPAPALVLAIVAPFLHGCMGVVGHPLADPPERPAGEIRGIVVRDADGDERIEPDPLLDVLWTDSTVVLTGTFAPPDPASAAGSGTVETRSYPLTDVTAVLIRELDGNRTSLIIAAVLVGGAAIGALLLTGKSDEGTVLPGG